MPGPRSDSERTRARLLDAAARLFARHGVQAVSLRAVNTAAGARNVSAAHYHFGSKDRLVRALVARRMEEIARERLAALDVVEAAAGPEGPDLHALVEAMVLPFLGVFRGDGDAVTFLARVTLEAGPTLDELAPPAFWTMVHRLVGSLRRAVPHLADRALLLRVRFLFQQTFVAVADFHRRARGATSPAERQALETTVAELVDYLAGGLAAASRIVPDVAPPNATSRGGRHEADLRRVAARRPRGRNERAGTGKVSHR